MYCFTGEMSRRPRVCWRTASRLSALFDAAKTCGSAKATCGTGYVAKAAATKCTTCKADGDECCTKKGTSICPAVHRPSSPPACTQRLHVLPPLDAAKTCGSAKVTCGTGYAAKAATTTCATCKADGDECCTKTGKLRGGQDARAGRRHIELSLTEGGPTHHPPVCSSVACVSIRSSARGR